MAITLDESVSGLNTNTCALTNAGRCAIIGYTNDSGGTNPVTCTDGASASYTQQDNIYGSGDGAQNASLVKLSAASGTQTATVDFEQCLACLTYTGVDTAGTVVNATTNGTDATNGVGVKLAAAVPDFTTTVANSKAIIFVMLDPFTPGGTPVYVAHGGNLTQRLNVGNDWAYVAAFDADIASAGLVTGVFTIDIAAGAADTTGYTIMVVAVPPSGAGSPGIPPLTMRRLVDYSFPFDESLRRAAFSFPPVQAARAVLVTPRRPADIAPDDERVRRAVRVPTRVTAWQALSAVRRAQDVDTEDRARRAVASPVAPAAAIVLAKPVRLNEESADERTRRVATVPPNVAPWATLGPQRRTIDADPDESRSARTALAQVAPVTQGSAFAQPRKPPDADADDGWALRPALVAQVTAAQSSALAQPARRPADATDEDRARRPALTAPNVAAWPALGPQRRGPDDAPDDAPLRQRAGVAAAPAAQLTQLAQPPRRTDTIDEDRAKRPAFVAPAPVAQGSALARLRRPDDVAPDDCATARRGVVQPPVQASQLSQMRRAADEPADDASAVRRSAALPPAQYAQLWQPRRIADDTSDDARPRRPLISAQARAAVLTAPRRGVELEADDRATRRAALVPYATTPWRVLARQRRPVDTEQPEERRSRGVGLAIRSFGILVAKFRASKPVTRADASKPITRTDASKSVSRRKVSK